MLDQEPGVKKLLLFGTAIAVPLALVAFYFAVFDQPQPGVPTAQVAVAQGAGDQPPAGQPALPPNHPPIQGQGAPPGAQMPPGHPQVGGTAARPIRVPDSVKGKWAAVKLRIEDKAGGQGPQTVTAKLGSDIQVMGSPLTVHVGEFLPALQVGGSEVTSASNDPVNPAVFVTILDGGKEVFKGWLFAKFPEMQPFEHPQYRITLIEGIPKG
jgi:Uncharacterized protein conserved in bacteria (DUF2155)